MGNRFEDVLARIDSGGIIKPNDWDVIRETLKSHIARVAFMPFDWEWLIGQERYPNWIGFGHVHKLITNPGKQIHVCDLTQQQNLENSRKAVQKSIARAVDALMSTQPDIGAHLKSHITTGTFCTYTGDWDWRVSQ